MIRKVHQTQFPETPFCRTISVTRLGVSAEKVVATMEIPSSHQGILRPERKNSFVFFPDRFATTIPIIKKMALDNVKEIRSVTDLPILGLGGITYGKDAVEMLKHGANIVGIGSGVYFREMDVFRKVSEEMKVIMKKEGITSIEGLR